METKMIVAPVLLIVFNRPDLTAKTFAKIRAAKITKLYVAADGPRNEKEKQTCVTTRKTVLDNIDWDCEVKTLLRNENLGCKMGVSGAIDWFFENEEQGIILEDDCVPDLSFFQYCTELLKKYKRDKRIFHISGSNELDIEEDTRRDYLFNQFPFIWGWATWRDRWKLYDVYMRDYLNHKTMVLGHYSTSKNIKYLLEKSFYQAYKGTSNTWDFQWVYTIFKNKGLSIFPVKNLISNIGFDDRATHTTYYEPNRANRSTGFVNFPLKHPKSMSIEVSADNKWRVYLEGVGLYQRTKNSIKHRLKLKIIGSNLIPESLKRKLISDYN